MLKQIDWLPRRDERGAVALSFLHFFFLIGAYMMLRPVRETLAVRAGDTEWLFSAVFVVSLVVLPTFGYLVARFPKRVFMPACYIFFIVNLGAFGAWLEWQPQSLWAGRVFFIWLSVFNLFIVSVFWSLMVDIFSPEQGRRLFGLIAAGGSLGGMAGPLLALALVDRLGIGGLILSGAGLLLGAVVCQWRLLPLASHGAPETQAIGGSVWAGATALLKSRYLSGVALVLIFLPLIQTLLYFIQRDMVAAAFSDEADRLRWFSSVDLGTQVIGAALQLLVVGAVLKRFGAAIGLVIMPLITVIGLAALALSPNVLVLGVFQAIRRGGEYGLMKPSRELLLTAVSEEDKYKAKNFIDTAIYRGGDVASSWLARALIAGIGLAPAAIAALALAPALLWSGFSYKMGRRFERLNS